MEKVEDKTQKEIKDSERTLLVAIGGTDMYSKPALYPLIEKTIQQYLKENIDLPNNPNGDESIGDNKMGVCYLLLNTNDKTVFDNEYERRYNDDYDGKLYLEVNLIIEKNEHE